MSYVVLPSLQRHPDGRHLMSKDSPNSVALEKNKKTLLMSKMFLLVNSLILLLFLILYYFSFYFILVTS